MELSFDSTKIRQATIDFKVAKRALGGELARAFQSLVSDMNDAMYLKELPESPSVMLNDGGVRLSFLLRGDAFVDALPVYDAVVNLENWGEVHRIKLVNIRNAGQVLI